MKYIDTIGKLTNQSNTKQSILHIISRLDFAVFEITGSQGAGKKLISENIAESWIAQTKGEVIFLNPPCKIPAEEYSVFQSSFLQNNINGKLFTNIILESLKDIPHVGNSISAIVNELIKIENENILWQSLARIEKIIILKIKKLVDQKPVLFVCNDFENWDFDSGNFLIHIIKEQRQHPLFSKAFFIINNIHHIVSLEQLITERFFISAVTAEDLSLIIQEMNPRLTLSKEQENKLFTLTKGNLKLIYESLNLIGLNIIGDVQEYFGILKERIQRDTELATEVIHLLKETAFIGANVDSRLLQLFSDESKLNYNDTLEQTIRMELLNRKFYMISFKDRFIYDIFKEKTFRDKQYFLRLSDCIRTLYPTRYDLQSRYLYKGNLLDLATINFFLYLIKFYRENNKEYSLNEDEKKELARHILFPVYSKLCKAYTLYKRKKLCKAENIILSLYCATLEFRFEIDYLKALIVTNKYFDMDEFQEEIDILEAYDTVDFEKNCPEMYIRLLMILIEFYAEIGDFQKVNLCKKRILRFFIQYAATDKQIQYYEHCYKMKANAFYKIEIAAKYTKDAYIFFSKSENIPFNITKYYISTLNYSANEIVMGNYANAYTLLQNINVFLCKNNFLQTIHKDIYINNLAISGYFSNNLSLKECIYMISQIYRHAEESADYFLLKSNLAVLLSLSGRHANALNIFQNLYQDIRFMENGDEYYQYFILNNYCVLLWITGDEENAEKILLNLSNLSPLPLDNKYFQMHTQFLTELFKILTPDNLLKIKNWNTYFIQKHPQTVGKAWNFWGHILLLSELQIWSDF